MSENFSLSLIVPAYNEALSIREAVRENIDVLEKSGIPWEVIVVDDGSNDDTKKIATEAFGSHPGVIIHSKKNGGFGSAVKKGIELSTKNHISFAPVDSPLSKDILGQFLEFHPRADILVCYRTARLGYSLQMKLNSYIYQILISLLFGVRLKDYNWIHLYPRKIFEPDLQIGNDRIFMLAETLIRAHRKGYSFFEFPVEMIPRRAGKKTAASFKAQYNVFRDVFSFFLKSIFNRIS